MCLSKLTRSLLRGRELRRQAQEEVVDLVRPRKRLRAVRVVHVGDVVLAPRRARAAEEPEPVPLDGPADGPVDSSV